MPSVRRSTGSLPKFFRHLLNQGFLDSLPESVVAVNEDGCVLYMNEAAWRYTTARSRREILGRQVRDFLPPRVADRLDAIRKRRFRRGGIHTEEVSISFPGGHCRHFIDTWAILESRNGRVMVAIGRPIHRYMHMECRDIPLRVSVKPYGDVISIDRRSSRPVRK